MAVDLFLDGMKSPRTSDYSDATKCFATWEDSLASIANNLPASHPFPFIIQNDVLIMETDNAPSDLLKLLDPSEKLLLYMKQKKYHPAINIESVAITDKRVIFRKPSMLTIKKSFTDFSYADILNVTIEKGPLRSTLNLNLKLDGNDLIVDDIPNEQAQEAFRLIRQGIDDARTRFTT